MNYRDIYLFRSNYGTKDMRYHWIKIRPNARRFVKDLSSYFSIGLYTQARDINYALFIKNLLDPNDVFIESGIITDYDTKSRMKYLSVFQHSINIKNILIVDDRQEVWMSKDHYCVYIITPYRFWNMNNLKNPIKMAINDNYLEQMKNRLFKAYHDHFIVIKRFKKLSLRSKKINPKSKFLQSKYIVNKPITLQFSFSFHNRFIQLIKQNFWSFTSNLIIFLNKIASKKFLFCIQKTNPNMVKYNLSSIKLKKLIPKKLFKGYIYIQYSLKNCYKKIFSLPLHLSLEIYSENYFSKYWKSKKEIYKSNPIDFSKKKNLKTKQNIKIPFVLKFFQEKNNKYKKILFKTIS